MIWRLNRVGTDPETKANVSISITLNTHIFRDMSIGNIIYSNMRSIYSLINRDFLFHSRSEHIKQNNYL